MKYVRFDHLSSDECITLKEKFSEIIHEISTGNCIDIYDDYDINNNSYNILIPYDIDDKTMQEICQNIFDQVDKELGSHP